MIDGFNGPDDDDDDINDDPDYDINDDSENTSSDDSENSSSDRDDDSDHETVSDSDDVTDRDWHPSTPMKRPARRNVAKRVIIPVCFINIIFQDPAAGGKSKRNQ